jgi:tRNA (adenine22-N1)-methyltransferase
VLRLRLKSDASVRYPAYIQYTALLNAIVCNRFHQIIASHYTKLALDHTSSGPERPSGSLLKLSNRLTQIQSMVTPGYTHIWDCCCDHGLLGTELLARNAAEHVHFVDVLPELIDQLTTKLQRFYSPAHAAWHTHCLDVASLPLAQYAGKQLVIIAGVGGTLMTHFIQAIHQRQPEVPFDYLLCPVHQEYRLRQQLIALRYSLKQETLVRDNQRFYEVLLVSTVQAQKGVHSNISTVGDAIWHADTAEQARIAQDYRHKTLKHYQNVQRGNSEDVRHIIDAYHAVVIDSSAG